MTSDYNTGQAPLTMLQLGRMIQSTVASTPQLQNVWVIGETSDMRLSGGHCYLELIEKDDAGRTLARARANIWASLWPRLSRYFQNSTGMTLASGIKVMMKVSVSYHPAYGLSLTVSGIDPSYTMGDAMRHRNEILKRLQDEGVLNLNRSLSWNRPALNIAVISAQGAAGYGDFINQLFSSQRKIRFNVKLFPAVLQGERTAPTVIAALDAIAASSTPWDSVVIIRGGGSTSDLAAFDNYELALNVANFPVPVIVGIGHERDVTVLDYVANMRVKTPTAAAEWLISQAVAELDLIDRLSAEIYRLSADRIAGYRQQLAYFSALIPGTVSSAIQRANARIQNMALATASAGARLIPKNLTHISHLETALTQAPLQRIVSTRRELDAKASLISALSPQSVLARGFSLTVDSNGKAVTSTSHLCAGDIVLTRLADGSFYSTVNPKN